MRMFKIPGLLLLMIFIATLSCNNNENDKDNAAKDSISIISEEIVEQPEKEKEEVAIVEDQEKLQMLSPDEKIIFSFKTNKGKIMNIVLQNEEKYIAYRFGTENKVELQFPEKLENTFEQFTYSYYMRGGGAMNVGLDLNYISFKGDTHQFIIYEEHSSGDPENEEESLDVGIRIVDLKNNKETKIEGLSNSVKGSLIDLRFSDLIKVEQGEM